MGYSFTTVYENNPGLYSVDVSVGFYIDGEKCWAELKGIIDTGASQTSIDEEIAKTIGLTSIREEIYHGSGGKQNGHIYKTDLKINKVIYVEPFEIGSIKSSLKGVDVLIGTDILSRCDMTITHLNGNTKLTLEYPSKRNLDFTKE